MKIVISLYALKDYFEDDEGLYEAIELAFQELYRYDGKFIFDESLEKDVSKEVGKYHVGERTIVFWFASYLQGILRMTSKYKTYNLDCEYNRNIYDIKALPNFPNGTFPDLIIHRRRNNDNNLLIMEFKTYWNSNTEIDSLKVREFVDKKGSYKYKYGLVVVIGRTLEETTFEVYK